MKAYTILGVLRLKHPVVLLLIIGVSQLFSQTITTAQGNFVLTPPGELKGPSAARSAKSVAELAISAVVGDAEKFIADNKNLQNRISAYDSDNKKYGGDLADYNKELGVYDADLKRYNDALALYNKDLEPHDAAVAAYNARAPENRDTETYNQLMSGKKRLDNRLAALDAKKATLDSELAVLDGKKADLDNRYNDLKSRFIRLDTEYKSVNVKLEKAYHQLEQLYAYALEINKLLEKWKELVINTTNLNTPLEQLKGLSNKGWDN